MVVEDATSVRHRLVATFRKAQGITAVADAPAGEDALDLLDEFRPDLITLDLMLPGMSGVEVLEAIRARNSTATVVVFTNYPYPAFRRRCLALGADFFFGKSTDVGLILSRVRGYVKVDPLEGDSTDAPIAQPAREEGQT
jgi:DNA-binding NarL/FixJ family response regulator